MISLQEFNAMFRAVAGALAVHVLMVALIVIGTMDWQPFRQPQQTHVAIEAVIVDTSEIKKQRDEARRAQEMDDRRRDREEALRQQREREAEQRRQAEAEAARLEEQRKRDAQDRLMKLRQERERKLEEERDRQQRELEEVRKQREEAERKRKQEAERLKQLQAIREREQQEQLERQAVEQRQAQDFRAGQLATEREQYVATIAAIVTGNWLRPPTAQAGLRCRVRVIQIPGGEVISSSLVGRCNGDEATRRSILAAVQRTGALPYRGFEDVFTREIEFIFTYSGE